MVAASPMSPLSFFSRVVDSSAHSCHALRCFPYRHSSKELKRKNIFLVCQDRLRLRAFAFPPLCNLPDFDAADPAAFGSRLFRVKSLAESPPSVLHLAKHSIPNGFSQPPAIRSQHAKDRAKHKRTPQEQGKLLATKRSTQQKEILDCQKNNKTNTCWVTCTQKIR